MAGATSLGALPFYHTADALHAALQALVSRHESSLVFEWLADEDRPANASTPGAANLTGQDRIAVVHTRDGRRAARRQRVLVLGGEHAREMITSEVVLRLAHIIAAPAASAELPRLDFALIPLVNVGGRALFERGDYCRRTNRAGVDLNRNWPTAGWGAAEPSHLATDTWPGPAPFSEWETRAVARFARRWRPDVFLSVHSGQLALIAPMAGSFDAPPHHASHMRALAAVNRALRPPLRPERIGIAARRVGYLSAGTALDWMYSELNVSSAFAFEIGTWPAPLPRVNRPSRPTSAGGTGQLTPGSAPWWGAAAVEQSLRELMVNPTDPTYCLTHFSPGTAAEYERAVGHWSDACLVLAMQCANPVGVGNASEASSATSASEAARVPRATCAPLARGRAAAPAATSVERTDR